LSGVTFLNTKIFSNPLLISFSDLANVLFRERELLLFNSSSAALNLYN